ncbi:hypothetical protein PHYC_03189 [Phycisphaerales bacterium]|nr:hypothetical protein PHYC_03189 [Phycisphaerales bacterium]
MKTRLTALFVAAGASVALAQTDLTYQVRRYSPFNDNGWASTLDAQPGDRIEVRSVVSSHGSSGALALSQIIFQPLLSNWALDDRLITNVDLGLTGPGYNPAGIGPYGSLLTTPVGHVADLPGVYGRITPFASGAAPSSYFLRGHVHMLPTERVLRIAQNHITNWIGVGPTNSANNFNGGGGVTSAQPQLGGDRRSDFPSPAFGTQNLVTFKFGVILAPDTGRTLTISTPQEGIGGALRNGLFVREAWWFATEVEVYGSIRESVTVFPASINIGVPTDPNPSPPTVILGGFLLALHHRRRR